MDLRLRTRPAASQAREGIREGIREGATIVEVAGELDLHSAPQLRAELTRALEMSAPPRVLVDLVGVNFLDSTGVGVLVGALKRAREADGKLLFCNPQPRVCRVFEITGLVDVLPLFSTREAALAAFDSSAAPATDAPTAEQISTPASAAPQAVLSGAALAAGEGQ